MERIEEEGAPASAAASATVDEPSYDRAYRAFLHSAVLRLIHEDSVLGRIKMIRDRHAGPMRNVRTGAPLDQPMAEVGATMTLPRIVLRGTDIEGHTTMVHAFAQELKAEHGRTFYQRLGEICDAAGTSVQNFGQGVPTIEQLREMFRNMEFSFNEEGDLSGLELHVHPSQIDRAKEIIAAAERDEEINNILLQKRAEWLAKRAAVSGRKLSR